MTVSPLHRENIFQQWHGHFYFCSHETQSRSQMPLRLPHLLTAQPMVNRGRPCKPSAAAHCSTHATHFPSWKFRNPIITIAKVGADEWQPGSPSPCQTTLTPEQLQESTQFPADGYIYIYLHELWKNSTSDCLHILSGTDCCVHSVILWFCLFGFFWFCGLFFFLGGGGIGFFFFPFI